MSAETFYAKPNHISGLGRLASEIGSETLAAHRYFNEHATPLGDWQGEVFHSLLEPFDALRDMWRGRHVGLSSNCIEIGDRLNTAAWLYVDQENKNYDVLNAHTQLLPKELPGADRGSSSHAAVGVVVLYSDPEDYGHPDGIDYPSPATFPDDVAEVIADAAGWLGDVDDAIEEIVGRSPLRELIEPLGGNWNDLRRLGAAYRIAGEAMESGGTALERGTARVDEFWDGMAAVAYEDYAAKQVDAMRWEGSCGRVIEAVAERAADEIRRSVHTLVSTIRRFLEEEIDLTSGLNVLKFLSKKVPYVGWAYQIFTVYEIIRKGMDLCDKLVEQVRVVTDAFKEFLSLVASPSGYLNDQFERKLAPVTEKIEDAKLLWDVKVTADARPVYDLPEGPYSIGVGDEPWADA